MSRLLKRLISTQFMRYQEEKESDGLAQCQQKNAWQITINEGSWGDSPGDEPPQESVTFQMSTSWDHGGLGSHELFCDTGRL